MALIGKFDLAVIGGGHAGIEAAVAAARLGVHTVLFTLSLDAVGNLPCNPSIGGTAKGHLVREVDALGGCMGIAADETFIQSRMLNLGKGPAVHSLRVQTDRAKYHLYTKQLLENTKNLEIKQAEITEIVVEQDKVAGVRTKLGGSYTVNAVIIATGTYLGGKIYIGESSFESGPDGVSAASALTRNLLQLNLPLRRFKTGTPARVHRRSIHFEKLSCQPGDDQIVPFSFMTDHALYNQVDCHIAYTNEQTHQVIRDNLHRSPLYSGQIEGIGPRYCPSIEDKVVRFKDKTKHQLFIEPCGLDTQEMYLQGMSSSLPEDVQIALYRTVEGLEELEIMRPAYAIEYDCIDPLALKPTLETLRIQGLYGAGQFNGSSGYEEAAAQGLVAGVNAARKIQGKSEIIFARQQSYIGTLIDDLVTKGVSDPYRMMTSRSEYRLYLRQDNADERLTPLGREIGLVDDARWTTFKIMYENKEQLLHKTKSTRLSVDNTNLILEKHNSQPTTNSLTAAELLKRPEVRILDLMPFIAPGEPIDAGIANRVEIEIKYEGYIRRQLNQIKLVQKQENTRIPSGFSYANLAGLRLEAREKLDKIRPHSLGQAARIPGVSPSDISQLALALALCKNNKINKE